MLKFLPFWPSVSSVSKIALTLGIGLTLTLSATAQSDEGVLAQIQNLKFDIRRAKSQPNWRLSISSKDIADIEALIHRIPPQSLLFSVSYVLEKIKKAFTDMNVKE